MSQKILFVCLHGAGKSRIAAAFFNEIAPPNWTAISAGVEPQAELGLNAVRLLAGTPAEPFLDTAAPHPITAVVEPTHLVAIDCSVPGAEHWKLVHQQFDEGLREEIRTQVEALAAQLKVEVA